MAPPRRWLSLDIETLGKDSPEVTCAALAWLDDLDGKPRTRAYAASARSMTPQEAGAVLDDCLRAASKGWLLFTWNGLAFDLRVLSEAAGRPGDGASLATSDFHVDGMLHFFCEHGYAVGLDAVCRGLNLPSKLDGMSGKDAPDLWLAGERERVLAYVQNDAAIQLRVAVEVENRGRIEWMTKPRPPKPSTRARRELSRWLSVPCALELPEPDVEWMRGGDMEPWPRSKFTGWADRVLAECRKRDA